MQEATTFHFVELVLEKAGPFGYDIKRHDHFIFILEPPVVTVEPRNQTFRTGQEVWIRCSAKGYPSPMVVWIHNDMFIMGSSR